MGEHDEPTRDEEGAESLVAFFRALTPAARREYEQLAERDRRFGEDVAAEARG